jgi:hypothetical protein
MSLFLQSIEAGINNNIDVDLRNIIKNNKKQF